MVSTLETNFDKEQNNGKLEIKYWAKMKSIKISARENNPHAYIFVLNISFF